jgi:hypothetical protein
MGRITFEDGVKDLLNDYTVNGKKTHDDVKRRIELHLGKQEVDGRKVFAGRKLANITTSDIRAYVVARGYASAISPFCGVLFCSARKTPSP